MGNILFSNVRIFDGSGELSYFGEVLIQGNRINHVGRGSRTVPANGHTVIDGAGATLMPGLTEAHTHFSWNNAPSLDAIFRMPPEEHTLFSANVARTYIDMGFTSAVGAAAAKPRLDVVIRNAINSGLIPGPRYLANSQEIATLGGLGDTSPPHVQVQELSFGWVITGPEEMRKAVRMFIKYGVDLIKLNLSGEEMTDTAAQETPMADEEAAMAVREAKRRGLRVCAHARSAESVKMCIRHGIEIIYHASYADEEALDMPEAHKSKHVVAPGLGWRRAGAGWGTRRATPGRSASSPTRRSASTMPASWRSRWRRCARCIAAASACYPAATTASPGPPTARTPRTSSISSTWWACRRWRRSSRPPSMAARSWAALGSWASSSRAISPT